MAGVVNTTYTFSTGDTITSTKMNDIIDQTTFTSDAITGSTLNVSTGKLFVNTAGITSNELASSSVTTAKIANGSITSEKLAAGGPAWGSGTTFLQPALELGYGNTSDQTSFIDFHASVGTDYNARIIRNSGVNGDFSVANFGNGNFSIANYGSGGIIVSPGSGLVLGTALVPTPSGTAPVYGARAWCNFNATKNAAGSIDSTNTARFLNGNSSSNIASVTKTASGKYIVDFITDMPNANYAVIAGMTISDDNSEDYQRVPKIYSQTTGGFSIAFWSGGSGSGAANPVSGTFAVFA